MYRELTQFAEKIGKCVLKRVLEKENAVDLNESTAFVVVEVTGLELYTMLLVIKNIAVYCYIILFYHILFLLFHTFKKKSVYF